MTHPSRAPLAGALAAAALALAACGVDTEPADTTARSTATTPAIADTVMAPTTDSQVPPPNTISDEPPSRTTRPDCPDGSGHAIEIVTGRISCREARAAADGYDTSGPKVQRSGSFTCEGSEADTRPIIFTCVSGEGEFLVADPSP